MHCTVVGSCREDKPYYQTDGSGGQARRDVGDHNDRDQLLGHHDHRSLC